MGNPAGNPNHVEFLSTDSGAYLVFGADTDIVERLRHGGVHDPDVIATALELIRAHGTGSVLVDAGAHLGTFAIPVAGAAGLHVEAFEAQRPIAHLLGANFVLNGLEAARVHALALGAPDQPATVEIPRADFSRPGNFGAFSVDPAVFRDRSEARLATRGGTDIVERRTLDSFALDDVALIKIDVEGEELSVLEGAVETIRRCGRPPLLFECWRSEDYADLRARTIAFAESLGYNCRPFGENIAARARP